MRAVRTFRERGEDGDRDIVAEERILSLIGEFAFRYRRDGDRTKTGIVVELPQIIADSIARKHYRLVNVGLYFGLETPTVRRRFRYLDIKRWRGREGKNDDDDPPTGRRLPA